MGADKRVEAGVPEQLVWIDEVLKAPDVNDAGKVRLLYSAALDYWRRLELAESRVADLENDRHLLAQEQQAHERESFERITALRLALRDLLDAIGGAPCRFDHHGYCQEHFVSSPCEVATARHILENVLDAEH